jgi:hypothetical protein
VFKHSDNIAYWCIQYDGWWSSQFGAAQYPGRYSNFTLDDKLLNIMDEMNNAVPIILQPFHPKGKMLCCTGHLN